MNDNEAWLFMRDKIEYFLFAFTCNSESSVNLGGNGVWSGFIFSMFRLIYIELAHFMLYSSFIIYNVIVWRKKILSSAATLWMECPSLDCKKKIIIILWFCVCRHGIKSIGNCRKIFVPFLRLFNRYGKG